MESDASGCEPGYVPPMATPGEYGDARQALTDGLLLEPRWKECLEDYQPTSCSIATGRVISSILLLTGPTAPKYIEARSSDDRGLSALVFTDEMLIVATVNPPSEVIQAERQIHVEAVPLAVESLAIASSVTPWDPGHGGAPQWPGHVTATVKVRGRGEITLPARRALNQEERDAVRRLVDHLASRLRQAPA